MKKIISTLLAFALLTNTVIFATSVTSDIESALKNHWSAEFVKEMYELDVITSSEDAKKPDEAITRLDFMQYINRIFNLVDTVEISFIDVTGNESYVEDIKKAVAHGYILGDADNEMRPLDPITRQEAVVVLSRLHKIEEAKNTNLSFVDESKIDSWAKGYVSLAVEKGYIVGNNKNEFNPHGDITRGEISKILYYFAGNIATDNEVTQDDLIKDVKNLTISQTDEEVTVKNVYVEGDMFITAGAENSTILLQNVQVDGKIIVAGNDTTVEFTNVFCDEIVTSHDYQTLKIDDATSVDDLLVYGNTYLMGNGVSNIVTKKDDVEIVIEGEFGDLLLLSRAYITVKNSNLDKIYIIGDAESSTIDMEFSVVQSASIQTKSSINGGYIYEVSVKSLGVDINCDFTKLNIAFGFNLND